MRDRLKKTLWPFLAKPWTSPVMETRYGLWGGVSALYSASGRQLGEANTRPFMLNHQIPAETILCKYEGSRAGRPINISALRIAMRRFDEALAITGAVRRHHLGRIGSDGPPGIWDLYIMARASIAMIAYRQRFAGQAKPGSSVPDALASQYQFISGIFMICRDLMGRADRLIALNHTVSAEQLYRCADANGIFVSPNGMACAGSTKKIMDFMTFCITGAVEGDGGPAQPDAPPVTMADLVAEPDNWYRYALATIELDGFLELERLRRAAPAETACADGAETTPASIVRDLSAYAASLLDSPLDVSGAQDFAQGALARQNRILRLLGRPPIRAIATRHLDERVGPAPRH